MTKLSITTTKATYLHGFNELPKMIRGRCAPSPTGRMHLGNVFSALLSWLSAKSKGGEWLLRIEDIDPQRSKQEYADQIMRDLEWLSLPWDGTPVYQSRRSDIYQHYYERLQRMGLTYPCYCTRNDILATQAPHESDGRVVYKGTCRPLHRDFITANDNLSRPAAIRLMVNDTSITFNDGHYGAQTVNMAKQVGDFIIRRRDGAWAYQLAVVIDDALTGVNEVVRGRDLILSSPQQMYVAGLLGFDTPHFIHLPLLCNTAGQRLSKRDKSLDLGALREHNTPEEITGQLAFLAGIAPTPSPITPQELLPLFDWNKIPLTDIMTAPTAALTP